MENEEIEKDYKIVTKEELEAKIKERKLKVSYYTPVWVKESNPEYDNKVSLFTESKMMISGVSIYYDVGDYRIGRDELYRMLCNSDVIIIKKLDDLLSILQEDFVRTLANMNSGKDIYIVDYENKNFIEINISLLLWHFFEEVRNPEMLCDDFAEIKISLLWHFFEEARDPKMLHDDFAEISRKYYDGKL